MPTLQVSPPGDSRASYTSSLYSAYLCRGAYASWLSGMTQNLLNPHSAVRVGAPVQLWSVSKTYGAGSQSVAALDDVTIGFDAGAFTAVMGPSGSGKSTLMHCAAGLDRADAGRIVVAGTELGPLSERALTQLRRDTIGFVFQSFNLVSALTAAQNVALPLRLARRRPSPDVVHEALAAVGLIDRAHHRPAELSGGQQQRVAIARALVTKPPVLFADEPTGALDLASSRDVVARLRGLAQEQGMTVVAVTHDPLVAAAAHRVVFLADGRVRDDIYAPPGEALDAAAIAAHMATVEA